ncbi:hypothetical protein QU487_20460 [Crenobacter sp. SG2305]|uniref:hypothetical protein n=1 Tax=Crenobacter oryzisoli TaxID=3056844 RepID=UPI0025AA5076|nr:hypothetical protein [Crenobacter sp. SG2305]MDN0085084.1 hypothetical protein [Crenobacter sp. SG2305]
MILLIIGLVVRLTAKEYSLFAWLNLDRNGERRWISIKLRRSRYWHAMVLFLLAIKALSVA